MILYVSSELNEIFQKIVFRHKNNELHMRRSNPVTIALYLLTEASFQWGDSFLSEIIVKFKKFSFARKL